MAVFFSFQPVFYSDTAVRWWFPLVFSDFSMQFSPRFLCSFLLLFYAVFSPFSMQFSLFSMKFSLRFLDSFLPLFYAVFSVFYAVFFPFSPCFLLGYCCSVAVIFIFLRFLWSFLPVFSPVTAVRWWFSSVFSSFSMQFSPLFLFRYKSNLYYTSRRYIYNTTILHNHIQKSLILMIFLEASDCTDESR